MNYYAIHAGFAIDELAQLERALIAAIKQKDNKRAMVLMDLRDTKANEVRMFDRLARLRVKKGDR